MLAALVLARGHDPGRKMGDAHRRVRLVHVLAPGARGTVGVDAQVLLVDLDLVGDVLEERSHVEGGEARLAPVLGVERRHAHEAVHAPLGGEQPVGEAPAHDERRRQDARLPAF